MISRVLSHEAGSEEIASSLPHQANFNAADNPYTSKEFFKIYEDYGVPDDPMRYGDEKFYWTYQRGVRWPDDYIGPDSMTYWITEKSQSFNDVGLLRISESVRAYAYLILSSQASARSIVVVNTASALTAQKAFLNNFEDIVNRRVNIQEDIKRYQDTLSYASSEVDYSVGENIYMLPSDMNFKIRSGTVGYNNKILVSGSGFSLGKNDMVSSLESPVPKADHKEVLTSHQKQAITHKDSGQSTILHEEEKSALILVITGGLTMWFIFR